MSLPPTPSSGAGHVRHLPVETRRRLCILRALADTPTIPCSAPTLRYALTAAVVPTTDAELTASIAWLIARKLAGPADGAVAPTKLGRLVARGAVIDGALFARRDADSGVAILETAIRDLRRRQQPAPAALLGLVRDVVAGRPIADTLTRADLRRLFHAASVAIRDAAPTPATD